VERPAVSLAYTEVEAAMTANLDQLDRTKIGINEKNSFTHRRVGSGCDL
jgi:hypothetical protein